jgi:hypothetical protein
VPSAPYSRMSVAPFATLIRAPEMSVVSSATLDFRGDGTGGYLTNGHSPSLSGRNAWSAGIVVRTL